MGIGTALAIVGSTLIGSKLASNAQKDAAETASVAQQESAQAGIDAQLEATGMAIDEQQRQFDATQELLAPYVNAGERALAGQFGLIGLSGKAAQEDAIQGLANSPQMQALADQGENALRQNASATGGLRGGNTQAALAQYRPQLLSQMIESQYSKLGGLTGIGQASATGQAAQGQAMAGNVAGLLQQSGINQANLLQQQGAAQAGNALAQGQAQANMYGNVVNSIGTIAGMGGF